MYFSNLLLHPSLGLLPYQCPCTSLLHMDLTHSGATTRLSTKPSNRVTSRPVLCKGAISPLQWQPLKSSDFKSLLSPPTHIMAQDKRKQSSNQNHIHQKHTKKTIRPHAATSTSLSHHCKSHQCALCLSNLYTAQWLSAFGGEKKEEIFQNLRQEDNIIKDLCAHFIKYLALSILNILWSYFPSVFLYVFHKFICSNHNHIQSMELFFIFWNSLKKKNGIR